MAAIARAQARRLRRKRLREGDAAPKGKGGDEPTTPGWARRAVLGATLATGAASLSGGGPAWAWHPEWQPALIGRDWRTPTGFGRFVRASLAQGARPRP